MTSAEFLNELKMCLEGEVPPKVIQETVQYYSQYIIDEINAGKTEEQVTASIGSPRLIAKSVIDANKGATRKEEERQEEARKREEKEREKENRRFHAEVNDDGHLDLKYGKFTLNSWYGKLILILLAVLLLILVIAGIIAFIIIGWHLLPVIAVLGFAALLVFIIVRLARNSK